MSQVFERREYLRADLNVFINTEGIDGARLARANNISESGLLFFLPLEKSDQEPTTVVVEFTLPDEEIPVRALGKIVHDSKNGAMEKTAVEFTAINTKDATRIRNYVIRRKRAEIFEQLRREHLAA
jgi:hypothetical protein